MTLARALPLRRARGAALAWAALLAIDLLGRARYLAPRLVTPRGALNYLGSALALFIVVRLVAVARGRVRLALVAAVIALPMAIEWAVFRSYGQFVSPTDFVAFFESPGVVLQAAGSGADALGSVLVFALALGTAWLLPAVPAPLPRWSLALHVVVLVGAIVTGTTWWRASPTLGHAQPAFFSAVAGLARRATVHAGRHGRTPPPRATHTAAPDAGAEPRLPNVVLVIGESLAASHLSIYGYDRPTTPRLSARVSRREVIPLRDAAVMGPHTRTSVPYIMTGLAGPDPNGRVFRASTITEYGKARGYHTAFISAQEESWGELDAMLREGADTFKSGIAYAPQVDVLKGADDLVVLEKGVLPTLASLPEPFFLVLHMDGSHLPYSQHSPPSHKLFSEEEGVNSIGAYDNTIRVTDEFLDRTFEALRARDPEAWMFFTSDHGQPLGEGGAFYNHGYQPNVVRDPLLVFPPPSADPLTWSALENAQTAACDVAPTILHLMRTAPPPTAPMDCVDWLAGPPKPHVRVVSAYTPMYLLEPTMLLLMPDGERALYDLARGTVTLNDGVLRPIAERPLPPEVAARLE